MVIPSRTPLRMVRWMLGMAQDGRENQADDLGRGDDRATVTVARRYGAGVLGIESASRATCGVTC